MDGEPTVDEMWAVASDEMPSTEGEPTSNLEAQPEPTEPSSSQPDIASLLAQMAQMQAQLDQLPDWMQQVTRRTQQSLRDVGDSIVQRVEMQTAPMESMLNGLVEDGLITQEDANLRLAAFERQTRRRELVNDQQRRQYQQQQEQAQQLAQMQQQSSPKPDWAVSVEREMARVLAASGITAQDPENAMLPSEITHPDPVEALDYYRTKVETARRAKAARLGQTSPNGARSAVQQNPIYVDMGGGAGAGLRDGDAVARELLAEMSKANPDMERVATLNRALDKYVGK